jgi:hypothetical protein
MTVKKVSELKEYHKGTANLTITIPFYHTFTRHPPRFNTLFQ